jgi:hypothetical protein
VQVDANVNVIALQACSSNCNTITLALEHMGHLNIKREQ